MILPVLLLVVAMTQVVRVVALDQSTWQGAGFGMFATYDFDDTRSAVAVAVMADGNESLLSLEGIGDEMRRHLLVVPSDTALRTVGETLVSKAPPGTEAVRIEVRGPRLREGTVHYVVVNQVTVNA